MVTLPGRFGVISNFRYHVFLCRKKVGSMIESEIITIFGMAEIIRYAKVLEDVFLH